MRTAQIGHDLRLVLKFYFEVKNSELLRSLHKAGWHFQNVQQVYAFVALQVLSERTIWRLVCHSWFYKYTPYRHEWRWPAPLQRSRLNQVVLPRSSAGALLEGRSDKKKEMVIKYFHSQEKCHNIYIMPNTVKKAAVYCILYFCMIRQKVNISVAKNY